MNDRSVNIVSFIVSVISLTIISGVSWLVTCGMTKIVLSLAGATFTWGLGTAVWLALLFVCVFMNIINAIGEVSDSKENENSNE